MLSTVVDGSARRLTWTVFVSVAFGMVALYAAFTAAPLVAEDITGTRAWSGLPGAAAILGTAVGAAALSGVMSRRGRRPGLVAGWTLGVLGAVAALFATQVGSLVLLVVGMLVVGVGHGANQLARFAACDPHPPARRGTVLSLVVWAGTIGAAVGPNLLGPTGTAADGFGLLPLTGGYLTAAVAFAAAAAITVVALRPDPATLVERTASRSAGRAGGWGRETVVAVAALVAAQFVMLLIMTMTPVHIRGHGHGLVAVGVVMSVHFAGMFALAPVAGRASDRFGGLRVALFGLLFVAASGILAAVAPTTSMTVLAIALLLLGLGWSAAFVASSALLARKGVTVQGRADAVGWTFAALASVASGMLIATIGYTTLCLVGVAISGLAAAIVFGEIRRPADRIPEKAPV